MEREFPKFIKTEEGKITVSETFYSIQGEGRYIGTPAVFLRTQGCLLNCKWCDTYDVWKTGKIYTYQELAELWKENGYIKAISLGAHIILTGGEPLARQKELFEFRTYLQEHYYRDFFWTPFIEVETAGTVLPNKLTEWVNYYNVSPKLSNSGMEIDRRNNERAMKYFSFLSWNNKDQKTPSSSFKFVVSNEEDVKEAMDTYIQPYHINLNSVYLMAEAQTKKELNEQEGKIVELAKKYGLKYSTRLHLHIWDKATGV